MNIAPVKINNFNGYGYSCQKQNKVPVLSFLAKDSYKQTLGKGQFYNTQGCVQNYHYTSYARGDIEWNTFGQYLKEQFSDISDVNILVFGCSEGQEAYTLAFLLKKMYPNSSFKIKAMDIEQSMIDECKRKQNFGDISPKDIDTIKTRLNLDEAQAKNCFYDISKHRFKIRPEIQQAIEFKKENILEYPFKKNLKKPTIILMRNMWPYIDEREYYKFAKKLYDSLPSGSVVVIGWFDKFSSLFDKTLLSAGFDTNEKIPEDKKRYSQTSSLVFEKK